MVLIALNHVIIIVHLGYIIEKKTDADDRPTNFDADNRTPHVGLRYTVRGLPTDTRWSFRVRAVNSLGVSEPSEPTETLLIQSDEGNYRHCFKVNFTIIFKSDFNKFEFSQVK